jgi:hypothetical protein
MANQPHVIDIQILPDGQIIGEVKGVAGPDCTLLSSWLAEIGEVTVDKHTADFNKPKKVLTSTFQKSG